MKLLNFAKIFETEFGQALATKEFDEDDETHNIVISISSDLLDTSMKLGYKEKEGRDEVFEKLSLEDVTPIVKGMVDTISKLIE